MKILVLIMSFIFMEFVSWFTHKYIMHGFLWVLHYDHHVVDKNRKTQKNDFFFLIFAIPSIVLIYLGYSTLDYMFFIGLGIAGYGFAYFLVHEIIIHRRLPFLKRINNRYIKGLRMAHKVHHKHLKKKGATCFGMLIVPKKYFKL